VELSLQICPVADSATAVEGTLLWSSLVSGWNRRELAGQWEEGRKKLVLHDLRVAEERPQGEWYFCVIDRYELKKVDGRTLVGRYDSAACQDHAAIRLLREGGTAAGTGQEKAVPLTGQEQVVKKPWFRGCSSGPGVGGWGLIGVLVGWGRRRRRPPPKAKRTAPAGLPPTR
jgi:MYXO-CTERM domain-containing protein